MRCKSGLSIHWQAPKSTSSTSFIIKQPRQSPTNKRYVTVQRIEDDWFRDDWRDEVMITNEYPEHRSEFLNFLDEFEDMLDRQLRCITTAKNPPVITNRNIRLRHGVPYRSAPTARQVATTELARVLQEEVIDPTTTGSESSLFFAT